MRELYATPHHTTPHRISVLRAQSSSRTLPNLSSKEYWVACWVRLRVRSMVLSAVLLTACGTAPDEDGGAAGGADSQLVVEPASRIGEGETSEFSFNRITGLALDADGAVYVSDGQAHHVNVFDASGAHVATIGRRGQGPGEFEYPTSLAVAEDGALWVRDSERLQRFPRAVDDRSPSARAEPERSAWADSRSSTRAEPQRVAALGMFDWTSQRTGVVDVDGLFHAPRTRLAREQPPRQVQAMIRFDASGAIRDSLVVPPYKALPSYAIVRLSANDGRMLRGLGYAPFTPVPHWASTPRGTIISGDGRTYELVETNAAGEEVRRFLGATELVPIDPRERADSLAALSARLDSLQYPLAQVEGMSDEVRRRELPATYPAHRELAVSAEGMLWVRRWSAGMTDGQKRSVFDVFSPDARYVGHVVLTADLRADPVLVIRGKHAVGVAVDIETGLESLVRFEVPAAVQGETLPPARP